MAIEYNDVREYVNILEKARLLKKVENADRNRAWSCIQLNVISTNYRGNAYSFCNSGNTPLAGETWNTLIASGLTAAIFDVLY